MSFKDGSEELICGFTVSPKRKEVWRIELDMVKEFIRICKKYGFTYFAAGGTLIGAVRHNGFIPWDDDIDLMMPRADYEKFVEVAGDELPERYFLQCSDTEKLYYNGHLQIRDNLTTCFTTNSYCDLKLSKNCGIFIDVFPYDCVPDDKKQKENQVKKISKLKTRVWRYISGRYGVKNLKNFIKTIMYAPYFVFNGCQKIIKEIDKLSAKFKDTNKVGLISFAPGYEKEVWDKALFDESVECEFEDIKIAIPKRYDEVLRHEFGDYMQIPEDKAGSVHGACYFDTENSYTQYRGIKEAEFKKLFIKNVL